MKQAAAWDAIRGEDGILRLVLDLPGEKVNKLTEAVLAAFRKLLQTIREDSDLRGVIIRSGKPGTFIAGADVGEIQ
ncbi:MAG: enoyl-CoA hydratase-related protein, partial [Acidobacteriota bacterium]